MTRQAAATFTFRVHALFPPNDPLSVPMLRLMAAANDTRHVRKLLAIAFDAHAHAIGTSERLVIDGEIGYLQRMLCGHLYEAGIAFRRLQEVAHGCLDKLLEGDRVAMGALANVRSIYMDESEDSYYRRVLGGIRTLAAFHYKEDRFRDWLARAENENARAVIVPEAAGLGRYTVTDNFATRFVTNLCGGTEDDLGKQLSRTIPLASSLEDVVDHLLSRLLDARPEAGVAVEEDEVTIPDAIERQRPSAHQQPTSSGGPPV